MQKIPVLIVGGGPVGLALAGELGWRGVPCLLVEQGDGTIVTPKMNEVNVRTMEFCRRWGIADKVHNCPFPADHAARRGVRHELHRLRARPHSAARRRQRQAREPWSPMRLQTCSQMWFDPILRDFALSSPCVHAALSHPARILRGHRRGRQRRDRRSRHRQARAHRSGLSRRLRRRHQRDPRRSSASG